jgi:hypothetical protein
MFLFKNHIQLLDISKTVDTINLRYLLDIISYLGLGQCWRNWVSAPWASSSSMLLVNSEPGRRIQGVRQGDPMSPMLFLLAMEPLHVLFRFGRNSGELCYLHENCASFRMSLSFLHNRTFPQPNTFYSFLVMPRD